MQKNRKQEVGQAISCLLCAIVTWSQLDALGASEFSGGWVTGRLFKMAGDGSILFLLALVVSFFFRRIAAAIALSASLLCLPLYLYFTAPGPFRQVFRGEYSVPLKASFVWNNWAIAGILCLVVAVTVCVRSFLVVNDQTAPDRGTGESG